MGKSFRIRRAREVVGAQPYGVLVELVEAGGAQRS